MKPLWLPVVLLLAGCGAIRDFEMPSPGDWFSRENRVEVAELRRAPLCHTAGPEPRVTLLPDLAAARHFEATRGVALLGDEPLPPGPYALVEHGSRNTAGYGVAISRTAGRRGDVLLLKGTFLAPGPGRMVAQVVTSPCVLVGLPLAQYAAVELIDEDGRLRASSARP